MKNMFFWRKEKKYSSPEEFQQELMMRFTNLVKSDLRFRQVRFFGFVLLMVGGFIFYGWMLHVMQTQGQGTVRGDYITRVVVSGPIAAETKASAAIVNKTLEVAFKDKKARGVMIEINSPGGSPVQSDMIRRKIIDLKTKYKKDVIAYGGDMMTSGAYMIAVGADKIYASPSSIVGSIGVIAQSFGLTGLLDKFGVEPRILTAGKNKAMINPFTPLTDEAKKKMESVMNRLHRQFIQYVKDGRGDRIVGDQDLFTGEFWTGEESVKNGLIDGVGSIDDAIEVVFGKGLTVKTVQPQVGFTDFMKFFR